MILQQLARRTLDELASDLGFALVGVTQACDAPDFAHFCDWLDRGYAGSMQYLSDRREAYQHPNGILPGCQSLIVLAMPYEPHPRTLPSKQRTASLATEAQGRGTVAAYSAGKRDYHDVMHEHLKKIVAALQTMFPESQSRGVVDTAPLFERQFAQRAGLGWIGKNTLLLNRNLGSYFFLAAVLTTAVLEPDAIQAMDHCGTCRACLDACPTDAFVEPHVLDATRCISYWTIEHRGEIPVAMRQEIGDWLFGCDACQTVCPWNRKPQVTVHPDLQPHEWNEKTDCLFWLALDETTFRERFRKTPYWRTRLAGMQRNAMIVAANLNCIEATGLVTELLTSSDPMLRETAQWCLGQLQGAG